ncbi:mitogen-activated protein kinase kinase kinase 2, partial [Biomphalaria glabrata]
RHINENKFLYRVLSLVIALLATGWTSHPWLAFCILEGCFLKVLDNIDYGLPK